MKIEWFPKYLNRLQYLIRLLIFFVAAGAIAIPLMSLLPNTAEGEQVPAIVYISFGVFALIIIPARIIGLDIPRIKSAGQSPWLLFLFLVPGVGPVMQLLLLVLPPKREVQR